MSTIPVCGHRSEAVLAPAGGQLERRLFVVVLTIETIPQTQAARQAQGWA
jgi:hypothetical protein